MGRLVVRAVGRLLLAHGVVAGVIGRVSLRLLLVAGLALRLLALSLVSGVGGGGLGALLRLGLGLLLVLGRVAGVAGRLRLRLLLALRRVVGAAGVGLGPLLIADLRLGFRLGLLLVGRGGLGVIGGVGLGALLLLVAVPGLGGAPLGAGLVTRGGGLSLGLARTPRRPHNRRRRAAVLGEATAVAGWRTLAQRRRLRRGGDHRRDALDIGLALGALLLERHLLRLLALDMIVVEAPPVGVGLLRARPPALLGGQHAVAAGPPVGGIGGLALVVHGGVVQVLAAVEILGGDRQQARAVVRIGPPVAVVDLDQAGVVIGVFVLRVADQERIVAVAAVEVLPLAVRRLLDHPIFAAAGAPDPGLHAVVVDGVVRRAVGEGVADIIGVVDVTVDRVRRGRDPGDRRRGRQGARRRARRPPAAAQRRRAAGSRSARR